MLFSEKGIGRLIAAGIVIVVLILVAGVAYILVQSPGVSSSSSLSTSSSSSSSGSASSSSTSSSISSSSSSTSSSSTAHAGDTLVIDDFLYQGYSSGSNLLYESTNWPQWGEGSLYQTLITLNLTAEQNYNVLQFLPDLASTWTVSPDHSTYTFNLRPGVSYSDGHPFNAYSVWTQFYMLHYMYANQSSFWCGLGIFNLDNVNFGPHTLALINQSGLANPTSQLLSMMSDTSWPVYVDGPNTIVYHLNGPFLFFEGTAVGWLGLQFDPMYVLQHGGPGTPGAVNTFFNTHPIPGTGPYVETETVQSSHAIFQKNPNYWGKNLTPSEIANNPILDPGHYNTIVVQYKPDDVSRYADLTTKSAQIVALTASNFRLVLRDPSTYGWMTLKYPAGAERMAMNTQIFPTNITNVRLAIVHAINYSAIVQGAVFGYGTSFVGPETPNFGVYYNPANLSQYEYNIPMAEKYLADAGFPNGTGLPTMTMAIDTAAVSYEQPQAELLQSQLSEIGIKVNIQLVQTAQYYSYFGPFQYELQNAKQVPNFVFDGSIPYSPDFMSPTDYWSYFVTNSTLYGNYAIYDNPIVDVNVAFMFHSDNVTAILQHLAVAQTQVYKDAPYAWLYAAQLPIASGSYVYQKNVIGGFFTDPNLEGICTVPILNTIYPASG